MTHKPRPNRLYPVTSGPGTCITRMLNFAKLRPSLALLANRLRPQLVQQGRAVANRANLGVSRQAHGKGRLFSVGRIHFASCEDEIHESVGRVERKPGNNQHVKSFATSSNDQVEQECEDEIFSSIGERFTIFIFFILIYVLRNSPYFS